MSLIECNQAIPVTTLPVLSQRPSGVAQRVKCSLGLVTYALLIGQKAGTENPKLPNLADPLNFLRESSRLGASGMQVALGIKESSYIKKLRAFGEENDLFIEGTSVLPRTEAELDRFEKEMQTASQCGASVVRTVIMPGRRYEQFKTEAEYQAAAEQGKRMLQLAEPIARRSKLRLAVENHKDQLIEERVQLLEHFSSEYIGVCFDVGNSLALLEDPMKTAEAFAPWILTVHFKDQGVARYEDGFLLADVPVGQGAIDLPAVLSLLRGRCPKARLSLELITRDPLKVPVLTESYWPTLGRVPASRLAAALTLLKRNKNPEPFEVISNLPLVEQVKAEERNITDSLKFAVNQLGLTA